MRRLRNLSFIFLIGAGIASFNQGAKAWVQCAPTQTCDPSWCSDEFIACYADNGYGGCYQDTSCNGCAYECTPMN